MRSPAPSPASSPAPRSAAPAPRSAAPAPRLALLLLAGCSGGGKAGPCDGAAEFAACEADGGGEGVCLDGACEPVPACETCDAPGPAFPLPDTNLRLCMGSSADGGDGTIDCPGTAGTDACADTPYCGGDAQYGWDVDHAATARFSGAGGAEPVVTDTVTGLVWQGCAEGQSGADCSGGAAVRGDAYAAAAYCDALDWGGATDWVLPDAWQLQSIHDYGVTSPAMDPAAFPNAPSTFSQDYDQWWIECTWTATDYAGGGDVAWVVMVNSGDVSQGSGTTYHLNDRAAEGWEGCYARCVREAPRPTRARFVAREPVAGERVVADLWAERTWMGCSVGQAGEGCDGDATMLPWVDALAACEGETWGGYTDWRLPDVKELWSLVDTAARSPAIDGETFPNTPYYGPDTTPNIGNYWTSTARDYNDFALYVDFGSGFSHFYVQSEARHVRCVR